MPAALGNLGKAVAGVSLCWLDLVFADDIAAVTAFKDLTGDSGRRGEKRKPRVWVEIYEALASIAQWAIDACATGSVMGEGHLGTPLVLASGAGKKFAVLEPHFGRDSPPRPVCDALHSARVVHSEQSSERRRPAKLLDQLLICHTAH